MRAAHGGRTAIVTGGARGIGESSCDALLEAGTAVMVVDVDPEELAAFESRHRDREDQYSVIAADVSDENAWTGVVEGTSATLGTPTILVNNAGISPKHDGSKLLTEAMSLAEWHRVMDVNLTGAFLGTRAVLPHMRATGWGRIINISSQAARTGARVAGVHYGSTKAGMLGLTRTVAHEYGAFGITVNAITPGRFITAMAGDVAAEVNEQMLSTIPVGRFGVMSELGAAVRFLASDEAGFVTGATIDVNGGSYMG